MSENTRHVLVQGDARDLSFLEDESVHLVATSPPYWTLKRYRDHPGQMGHIADYEEFAEWFRQSWHMTGASTRDHPAPFPVELAYRLVRMFSFHGDTVLDPFCGTGSTMAAALRAGRHSIGVEIDPEYCRLAVQRLTEDSADLFGKPSFEFRGAVSAEARDVDGLLPTAVAAA